MADSLSVVWEADAHTIAKHAILKNYLNAWMPILSLRSAWMPNPASEEILFIDGFAGPGKYQGGEEGSPIIVLKAALQHPGSFPRPIRLLFIEKEPDRFQILKGVVEQYQEMVAQSEHVRLSPPIQGDCESVLTSMLNEYESRGQRFGPALVFLDQFGYSAVSMDLVRRIMEYDQCEVFSYLNWSWMNRFLPDKNKWAGITRAYGDEDWKQALHMQGNEREQFLLDLYNQRLQKRAGATYVRHFSMHDASGKLLYWLFFATKSLRGLEVMKKAMWKVDELGRFKFSDSQDASQLALFGSSHDDAWLAEHLGRALVGKTMTINDIKEYVLVHTPCYLFKGALRILEDSGRLKAINSPPERRKGTYPEDRMQVQFLSFQQKLF